MEKLDHDQFVLEDDSASALSQTPTHQIIDEYAKNATVHGLKYVFDRKRNRFERIFWLIALIISFVFFLIIFSKIWMRYSDGAITIEMKPEQKPIWDIPFPAITICTETKATSSVFKFKEVYRKMAPGKRPFNVTPDELSKIEALSQVCDSHLTTDFEFNQNTTTSDIFSKLRNMAPSAKDVLFFCKKRNVPYACHDFFSDVWTEDGLCFTYNILNSTSLYTPLMATDIPPIMHDKSKEHWDIETGYNEKASGDILSFPYRAHSGGHRGSLVILLNLNVSDFDHMCRGPIVGFKVTMHRPDEIPFVSREWFRVPMQQETFVSMKPHVTLTADSLRKYDADSRKCYYGDERKLTFFKTYTQRNCEMECLSDYIVKKCGCTKFAMPRFNSTPICGASKIFCYHKAEDDLLSNNIRDHLQGSTSPDSPDCNCLPACTTIKYDTEISQSHFDFKSLFEAYESPPEEYALLNMARITFAFKETYFDAMVRTEVYGLTEVIALCGGILALFFGASLLSLLEILYFCTVRWWFVLKNKFVSS